MVRFSLFIILLIGAAARADLPAGSFVESRVTGAPWSLSWDSGARELKLFVKRSRLARFDLPFEVTENSCVDVTVAPKCRFKLGFQRIESELRWTKHPDAQRVGQPPIIVYAPASESPLFLETVELSALSRLTLPKLAALIPLDEIECDTYSWIPGSVDGRAPDTVPVRSWLVQTMNSNVETGMNENGFSTVATGVSLARSDSGTLAVQGVQKFLGLNGSQEGTAFYAGDVIGLEFKGPSGACLVTLTASLSTASAAFDAFQKESKAAKDWNEYVYGPDELLTRLENSLIYGLFQNSGSYQPDGSYKVKFDERQLK